MATFICWSADGEDPGDVRTGRHVFASNYLGPAGAAEAWASHVFHTREPFTSLDVCVRQAGTYEATTYEVNVEAIPQFNAAPK